MKRELLTGMLAGAAGTTALNATTYLDMAVRGRPPSTTPEQTVRKGEALIGVSLSSESPDSQPAESRRSGIGALLGIAAGVGTGGVYGLLRPRLGRVPLVLLSLGAAAGANVGPMLPMAALGVTDPREWTLDSWITDLLPHLAYGVVTTAAFEAMQQRSRKLNDTTGSRTASSLSRCRPSRASASSCTATGVRRNVHGVRPRRRQGEDPDGWRVRLCRMAAVYRLFVDKPG